MAKFVVGLTGGVGTGKSVVLKIFAHRIDQQLAHVGKSAADNDHFRIKDVDHIGHADGEVAGDLCDSLFGFIVSLARSQLERQSVQAGLLSQGAA